MACGQNMILDGLCAICKEKEPLVTVTAREFEGLYKFSVKRKDDETKRYLNEKKGP